MLFFLNSKEKESCLYETGRHFSRKKALKEREIRAGCCKRFLMFLRVLRMSECLTVRAKIEKDLIKRDETVRHL